MPKVFGITGWKNAGKTTLVARLVEEFGRRNMTVSTIKHASHSYALDREGSDTHAHMKAGAYEVAIAAGNRWAVMHEGNLNEEPETLDTMLSRLSPCDLVLVEGFKTSAIPKLQVMRQDAREHTHMWTTNPTIIAVATDEELDSYEGPKFDINAVGVIADFVAKEAVVV